VAEGGASEERFLGGNKHLPPARGLGERCKLPQRSPGRRPSAETLPQMHFGRSNSQKSQEKAFIMATNVVYSSRFSIRFGFYGVLQILDSWELLPPPHQCPLSGYAYITER